MPSTSPAQHRLMEAAAHTPGGFGGVPQSVGKEFAMKDAYPTDPVEMGDTTTKLDAACSKMDGLARRMDACEARAAARRVDARVRGDVEPHIHDMVKRMAGDGPYYSCKTCGYKRKATQQDLDKDKKFAAMKKAGRVDARVRGDASEADLEAWAERQMDRLDRQLMNGQMSQKEYDKYVKELDTAVKRKLKGD